MEKDLGNKARLSPTLESRLREAVKLRNRLAHRYFLERDRNITTPEGREQMIIDLQTKAEFLKELDGEFTTLLEQWLFSKGGTEEELELELAKYLRGENVE